jgi:phage shock protein PspC (stress-responsive transcriptional regulator)
MSFNHIVTSNVDPVLVRAGFVATTFCFFPFAIVRYVALAIMMRSASTATEESDEVDY